MTSEDRLPVIKKPAPRNRGSKKLLLFLFVFFITLLLVLFFQSSLSQITEIEAQGQELVPAEEIKEAAAVKPGDHFFSVSSSGIEEKVKALRMVESVQVSKHFPGRILIEVKEYPKVAYQIGEDGQIEALLADASVVPVTLQGFVPDKPLLTGWGKEDPLKTKLCLVMSKLAPSYFADVSEIKPDPSPSYPDKIKMYTRSQFEVQTTVEYLPEKIIHLNTYIANLKENNHSGGILRLLEADSHTPFTSEQSSRKDGGAKTSAPLAKN